MANASKKAATKGAASASKHPKKNRAVAAQISKKDDLLVFKANCPLTDSQFAMLEKRLRDQEEKSGIKIVLVPYSVDLKEEV